MSLVIGVDAAAGKWLGVLLVDGAFVEADFQPTVADLLRLHPEVEKVAVERPFL